MNVVTVPPIIRLAATSDITVMVDLLAQLFAIESDFCAEPAKQATGLKELLQCGNSAVLIAESAGRAVGMVTVQVLISTAEGGRVGLIEDLVVCEDWRGRGLGGKLLRAAGDWACERGLTRLQLLADRDNAAALAFYRNQGWDGTSLIALRKHMR